MSSFLVILAAFLAAGNLGWAIYCVLQPKYNPANVALNFSTSLFISLMTVGIIANQFS